MKEGKRAPSLWLRLRLRLRARCEEEGGWKSPLCGCDYGTTVSATSITTHHKRHEREPARAEWCHHERQERRAPHERHERHGRHERYARRARHEEREPPARAEWCRALLCCDPAGAWFEC